MILTLSLSEFSVPLPEDPPQVVAGRTRPANLQFLTRKLSLTKALSTVYLIVRFRTFNRLLARPR